MKLRLPSSFRAYFSLSLAILLIGGMAFTGGLGYCLYKSRAMVTKLTDINVMRIVDEVFSYMEDRLKEAEEDNMYMAWVSEGYDTRSPVGRDVKEEDVFRFAEDALTLSPIACGVGVALLPEATHLTQGKYGFAAYVTTVSGQKERIRLGAVKDYTKMEWFAGAFKYNKPFWTHPYKESSTGRVIVSFCVPFRNLNGKCIGSLAMDINTEGICQRCHEMIPFESNSISLVDENFTFIRHADSTLLLKHADTDTHGMWAEYRRQIGDKSEIKLEDGTALYYFKRVPHTQWTICVKCPKDEIYADTRQMERDTTLAAALSLLLLLICLIHIFRRLQQITLAKANLDNEIKLAANIQLEMLPDATASPLSDPLIDLSGYICPAKDVGGDLYDYFVHDGHLYFCIGDVSGKGLPASFFMAATCSLFRNTAFTCDTITSAVESINRSLCVNNKRSMFVTFFVGKLNLSTGHLDYCNAGHNPPVLMSLDGDRPTCCRLESSEGFPLGVLEDSPYPTKSTILRPGDTLFLFTDGVTEAMNSHEEEFGDQRLMAILCNHQASSAADIVSNVRNNVNSHAGGAPQSDDITMLCIRLTEA